MSELLEQCEGFQWDKENSGKNWIRHQVTDTECEQVFLNKPLIVADDPKHSQTEKRWYLLKTYRLQSSLIRRFHYKKEFNPSYLCKRHE